MVRVAVDAMGGDFAPGAVVEGAIQASKRFGIEIYLVGTVDVIEREIDKLKLQSDIGGAKFTVVPASQVVEMGDDPIRAIRYKRDSSMSVALRMVKSGEADAFVSAGSTGAAYGIARSILGKVKGVTKPAIATIIPNMDSQTVLLDVGANVDCAPKDLIEFAIMGSIYSELMLGKKSPRVGLLNIGTEEVKGNELIFASRPLLREASVNFIGDVEGRDILNGSVDVVVCDGFVGNVILKTIEGAAQFITHLMKKEFTSSLAAKLGALFLRRPFKRLKNKVDYKEYGGAPLLGLNGACIIAHGSSCADAIRNAVRVGAAYVEKGITQKIEEKLKG